MPDEVRKLRTDIISRGVEIEAHRHIPSNLVEALRAIGIFRMFVPRSLSRPGTGSALGAGNHSSLAKIDGSVGWNSMIGSSGGIFVSLLPRETYDRIYQNGPATIVCRCGSTGRDSREAGVTTGDLGQNPRPRGSATVEQSFATVDHFAQRQHPFRMHAAAGERPASVALRRPAVDYRPANGASRRDGCSKWQPEETELTTSTLALTRQSRSSHRNY